MTRSFYGTLHVYEAEGRHYVTVQLLRDGQEMTRLSYEGSSLSFGTLDEGLSVLDGAALAWAIGATPPVPAPGGPADVG